MREVKLVNKRRKKNTQKSGLERDNVLLQITITSKQHKRTTHKKTETRNQDGRVPNRDSKHSSPSEYLLPLMQIIAQAQQEMRNVCWGFSFECVETRYSFRARR